MASTSAPEAADARFHPIPTSVIIVNEATPLVSQDQQLAGSQIHADPSFNLWSCVRLSSDESIREKQLQGLVLLVISSFLFAGVSVIVKLLGNTYPSFEIVLARGCVQLPLGLLGCAIVRVNPLGKKGVRKWIFFRALASSIALSFFFYSLTQLPLIDATVIFFLGPIFKVMIGCIVLHENFSILDVTYSILCFVGLLLVSKPSFLFNEVVSGDEYQRSFAVACALAAALMSAMAYITVRKVGQGTHVMVHVVYFGLVTALFSVPILLLQFQTFAMPVEKRDIELLVAIGILAFLGQYFINLGLKWAPQGPVTLLRTIDVVFAFLFGVILFKELPGFYTTVGSLLIVCMTTAMSLYRWHRQEIRVLAIKRRKSKDKLVQQQQRLQQQQPCT